MATAIQSAVGEPAGIDELLLYRRIAWRILPLTIVCFLFSYFDRINISFAKTQMQAELGLSDAAYGFAASIFFLVTCCSKCQAATASNATARRAGFVASWCHGDWRPPHSSSLITNTPCTSCAS